MIDVDTFDKLNSIRNDLDDISENIAETTGQIIVLSNDDNFESIDVSRILQYLDEALTYVCQAEACITRTNRILKSHNTEEQ